VQRCRCGWNAAIFTVFNVAGNFVIEDTRTQSPLFGCQWASRMVESNFRRGQFNINTGTLPVPMHDSGQRYGTVVTNGKMFLVT
jgi:hypothetical protein